MDYTHVAGAGKPDHSRGGRQDLSSTGLHDGLDWFLARVMFYGRVKLAGYRESGFASKTANFTIAGDVYRFPQNGVIADASIAGELVWYQKTVSSGREAPVPPARTRDSVQAVFWRMLTGSQRLSGHWLRALAFGLDFPEREIDSFVEDFERQWFTVPASADDSGSTLGLPRGCDPAEVKRMVREMAAYERASNARVEAQTDIELLSQCQTALKAIMTTPGSPDIQKLAEMLAATRLEPGWEREYEMSQSLYSGGVWRQDPSPVMDLVGCGGRVMVLGDPGHGKSTVLSALALAHRKETLVFRLRFEDLGEAALIHAERTPFAQRTLQWAVEVALDASVASGLDAVGTYERAAKILRESTNVLLLMDGLDEISSEKRRTLARNVTTILVGRPNGDGQWDGGLPGRIVMASRVAGYARPAEGIDEVLVAPLDKASLEPFMRLWFGESNPEGLARAVAAIADPDLASLARVPVIATFIAQIATKETPKTTKHDLYEQYITLFLSRPWRKTAKYDPLAPSRAQVLARLDFAAEVAWQMATWPAEGNIDQWADHLALGRLMAFPPAGQQRQSWYQGVEDLHTIDGLLIPHSGLDSDDLAEREVRWLHRTIHEHLTARKLVSILEDDYSKGVERISHLMCRPAWEETLDHAAGLLGARGFPEELLNDLWNLRDQGDSPSHRVLETIGKFACHSSAKSHKVRATGELLKRQWGYTSAHNMGEDALNTYFLGLEAESVRDEDVWQLCYQVGYLLQRRPDVPAAVALLQELSKKHWIGQSYLWRVQLGDDKDPAFRVRMTALPERSSLPSDLAPQEMAPLLVQILSSNLGTPLAVSSARDLLASRHPDARTMLDEATRDDGVEGDVLRLLNVGDDEGALISKVSDEFLEKLLTDSGVPPYMAYVAAAEHPNFRLVEELSGTPWAMAGLRSRWLGPGHSGDAARIAEMPGITWEQASAERAIDSLLPRHEPTPQDMEKFWSASHWLVTQRIPTRIVQMLQVHRLNDSEFWPQYWWTSPIFYLAHRISETFTHTEVLDQIQVTADFDIEDESILGGTLEKLSGQAKSDAVLDYVRRRISERRNRENIRFSLFRPFDDPETLALRLIDEAESADRESARALMDPVESLLLDGDKLWKHWPVVVRLAN